MSMWPSDDFRIGDKVRLKSTGQIGYVEVPSARCWDVGPYVRLDGDNYCTVITDPSDWWEMVEPIQRHSKFRP